MADESRQVILYDFTEANGANPFKIWGLALTHTEQGRLDEKLDHLERYGQDVGSQLLSRVTSYKKLWKLRFKVQNVQIRPILCRGPVRPLLEFTLLAGSKERDNKLTPRGVDEKAEANRKTVTKDHTRRRRHEWLGEA